MQLKTRRIQIAGIAESPNGEWVSQATRNLTDGEDGFLREASYLIIDRDTKFIPLRNYLKEHTEVKPLLLPPRSPNLNAYLERFMRSLKSECINRMIFFGRKSLGKALKEYSAHYHHERNHQGLDNQLINPIDHAADSTGAIQCRERLGGLLKYYYREAA